MLFKLFFFLFFLVVALFFIGFNLENRCDVSFIFYTFSNVPVVISLLTAYVVGAFSMLPFLLGRKKKKRPAETRKIAESKESKELKDNQDKQKGRQKNDTKKPVV